MKPIFMRKKTRLKANELYIIFNSFPMRILFEKMLSQNLRNVEGKFESRTCKKLAKIELPQRLYLLFPATAYLPFLKNDKIPVFTE